MERNYIGRNEHDQRIADLRHQEEGCASRIASIQRKLAAGSEAVDEQLLDKWKSEMALVQRALIALGELPSHSA